MDHFDDGDDTSGGDQLISNEHQCNDVDDAQPDDEVIAGGGGEQPLGEKLAHHFEVKDKWGETWKVFGGIALHWLTCEDCDQLERRADEINEKNINTTCRLDGGLYKEVRQASLPNSSPGHSTVARLLLRCLGLGAPAVEQGRRSQQGSKRELWNCVHPPVLCGSVRLNCSVQEPPCKGGQTRSRWAPLDYSFVVIIIISL